MDEQIARALSDIERRLAALEAPGLPAGRSRGIDKSVTTLISSILGAAVGAVALLVIFSDGNRVAWIAAGAVGVTAVAAAAALAFKAL